MKNKTKGNRNNNKNYIEEEIAAEINPTKGYPQPREVKSQKAQFESFGTPGMVERKDKKTHIHDKLK